VDDELRVNRTLRIPSDELEWRFTPSGGPGGQHANRSNTRVELRFDLAIARERLADKLRAALHIDKPRHATRPTAAAKRRRMDAKRRLGEKKQQRRPPSRNDD
jgi:ribosome-associated protein